MHVAVEFRALRLRAVQACQGRLHTSNIALNPSLQAQDETARRYKNTHNNNHHHQWHWSPLSGLGRFYIYFFDFIRRL